MTSDKYANRLFSEHILASCEVFSCDSLYVNAHYAVTYNIIIIITVAGLDCIQYVNYTVFHCSRERLSANNVCYTRHPLTGSLFLSPLIEF